MMCQGRKLNDGPPAICPQTAGQRQRWFPTTTPFVAAHEPAKVLAQSKPVLGLYKRLSSSKDKTGRIGFQPDLYGNLARQKLEAQRGLLSILIHLFRLLIVAAFRLPPRQPPWMKRNKAGEGAQNMIFR
jgi:hypothetical protein